MAGPDGPGSSLLSSSDFFCQLLEQFPFLWQSCEGKEPKILACQWFTLVLLMAGPFGPGSLMLMSFLPLVLLPRSFYGSFWLWPGFCFCTSLLLSLSSSPPMCCRSYSLKVKHFSLVFYGRAQRARLFHFYLLSFLLLSFLSFVFLCYISLVILSYYLYWPLGVSQGYTRITRRKK